MQIRHEAVLVGGDKGLVHRKVELRIRHDLDEIVAGLLANALRNREPRPGPSRYGDLGSNTFDDVIGNGLELEWLYARQLAERSARVEHAIFVAQCTLEACGAGVVGLSTRNR